MANLSQERIGKITASIAGAILGQSPFMSKAQALREMVLMAKGQKGFQGNKATDYGNRMESVARELYFQETFEYPEDTAEFFAFEGWLGATPDGLLEDRVIEIKSPYNKKLFSIADKQHYFTQVQIQMLCTGKDLCDFVVFDGNGITIEQVKRDDNYLNEIIPILKQAHGEFLQMLESSSDFELEALGDEYASLDAQIKELEEMKAKLKGLLIKKSNGSNLSLQSLTLTQSSRKGDYDYAKFVKDEGLNVPEGYKKPDTTSWTVRLKGVA